MSSSVNKFSGKLLSLIQKGFFLNSNLPVVAEEKKPLNSTLVFL